MAHTPQDKRKARNKPASSLQESSDIQAPDAGAVKGDDHHNRIAEYAFLMFAEGGFQHGHDLDHWLEAERRVIGH